MLGGDSPIFSARPRFFQILSLGSQLVTHIKYSLAFSLSPDWYFATVVTYHSLGNAVTGTLLSMEAVPPRQRPKLFKTYLQALLARIRDSKVARTAEPHSLFSDVKASTDWFSSKEVLLFVEPDSAVTRSISCNSQLLRHAFSVMLTNAIEASHRLPVVVKYAEYGHYTSVVINDAGCGMSKLDAMRCTWFGWSKKQHGLGLGLGAAKWILTKYCHADLRIYSTLGVGTTVICSFPH